MRSWLIIVSLFLYSEQGLCQSPISYDSLARKMMIAGLTSGQAYAMLAELSDSIGARLSGSENAAKAVRWGKKKMEDWGFDHVHLEPVTVPHWVRGNVEEANIVDSPLTEDKRLSICALGGTIGTPKDGITAEVLEVRSFSDLKTLKEKVKGKIIFFDRPMDRALFSTGSAYGGAVDQRSKGAAEAARYGAVAVLVRSMTTQLDDFPHTGAMNYVDSIPKIAAAAVSTLGAERLSRLLAKGRVTVQLKLSAQILPDVESANVVGELVGTEKPNEVITIGGHLDSWDKGRGAHDDGAGSVHCIEALRLMRSLGLRPKRTIRVVLFMNEENGLRGGKAYAEKDRPGEKHIAAIESDHGAFAPTGFSIESDSMTVEKIARWAYALKPLEADRLAKGGGGADISVLAKKGIPCLGMHTDGQKYFDYHHSDHDTIDTVNERELELGAIAVAVMAYVLAEEGI
jgi:carboxypeptidase Q